MIKSFKNVKGTYDYLPEQEIIRDNIKTILKEIFIKYGFAPVETPILCEYDLLASKYSEGADILNEMYKLNDQGQRKLGLRYDLTITFSKLISINSYIQLPFKRYEIGKVFRDGPVKLGRNREFTQCDVDMVGTESLMAEAEYMTMTAEAYEKLGLDIEILYNNRKLLSGIISVIFQTHDTKVIRNSIMLIDKYAKISHQELMSEFMKIGIEENKVNEITKILSLSFTELCQYLSNYKDNSMIFNGINELSELREYMKGTNAFSKMTFAAYLARGIDVYTGTVWEIFLKDRKINDIDFNISIGGGGRYDNIITSFINDGKTYPAVGMSFGLDVIYEILKIKLGNKHTSIIDLYIIPMDTEKDSFLLASSLRKLGIKVEVEKRKQKVRKSMDFANKSSIKFVIVLGENEILANKIKIKNLSTGISTEFPMNAFEDIVTYIKNS